MRLRNNKILPQAGTKAKSDGESGPLPSGSGSPTYSGGDTVSLSVQLQTVAGSQDQYTNHIGSSSSSIASNITLITPSAATDASQAATAMKPATTKAGKARVRMKWDTNINIFIMRTYFKVTKLETDLTMYRQKLHAIFNQEYPNTQITEQRLSDQRRAIVRNKYLTENIINNIKEEVSKQLESETHQASIDISQNNQNNSTTFDNPHNQTFSQIDDSYNTSDDLLPNTHTLNRHSPDINSEINSDNEIHEKLRDSFENNILKYKEIDVKIWPGLPKIKTNKQLSQIIAIFNTSILPPKLLHIKEISDTHLFIYCTALTITEHLNLKVRNKNISTNVSKPGWQIRLENDIEELRKDIGRLTQYKLGNRSKKLTSRVSTILEKNKIHSKYDNNNRKLEEYLDTLKQRLRVKSHRLSRYNKSLLRKNNNKLFTTNQKVFYRNLNSKESIQNAPPKSELIDFWSNIWSQSETHNLNASWITNEKNRKQYIQEMEFERIEVEELTSIINKTHNWKAAGIDSIHNFWFKRLKCTHNILAHQITESIKGHMFFPNFLTLGKTYMLPKSNRTQDPSQFRPITCLPTLYKIITACISNRINRHIESNKILAEEQKGCRRFHMGCKEQLIIDSTLLKHSQNKRKNLYTAYIDYKKAFDSVPHSWLIQILDIYKINPLIVNFLKNIMETWRTTLILRTDNKYITTDEITIRKGIFQGDSLSPLWFCLALNPLSIELNESELGHQIKNGKHNLSKISHLLYMDDLKLYADNEINITRLLDITKNFSQDIKMDFGLDKCRKLNIKRGKIVKGNYNLNENEEILAMDNQEFYKYLGYRQAKTLEHKNIKEQLKLEFIRRLHMLCRSNLNSKNMFRSINAYAIPVLTYSFGIIKWYTTEITNLEIKVRTVLTQYRYHHPKSAKERLTISRKEGGRGLIDLNLLHHKQINLLKHFFYQKKISSPLHNTICEIDSKYTPLNLSDTNIIPIDTVKHNNNKYNTWKQKELHGRHVNDISQQFVNKPATNKWLESAQLFPETEGFITAIQDQVINTKNYRKHIIKDKSLSDDLCRKCHAKPETIQHITGACITLTQNDYTHRHNQLAYIIHQKLAIKYSLIHSSYSRHSPYYKYLPLSILENSTHKIYFDRTIHTDHTIYNNRPDIILVDKIRKHTYIIDIAVPNTNNLQTTITEKIRKYTELQEEVKRIWKMNLVKIVPIVLSTTGVIPNHLLASLEILGLPKYTYLTLQKASILNTCRIVRKFLQLDTENSPGIQSPPSH